MSKNMIKSKSVGFTLLELLVVISIIALLVGVMIPVVNIAQRAAWRARTRDEVYQLANAWESYLLEHRKFPDEAITEMNVNQCLILTGQRVGAGMPVLATNSFFEFTTNQLAQGYSDRWGSIYKVSIDNGLAGDDGNAYNGIVRYGGQDITKNVAVWSDCGTTNDTSDDLKSWKEFE